jgi:hypothetical protein
MAGMVTEPMAAASAAEEPEISEKNIVDTITTNPSPPLTCLTSTLARFTSLIPTPPVSRKEPARMKSGMARRGKESRDVKIFWGMRIRDTLPFIRAVIALATPREKEMGALKAMKRKKRINRINSIWESVEVYLLIRA